MNHQLRKIFIEYKVNLKKLYNLYCDTIEKSKFSNVTKLKELKFSRYYINSLSENQFLTIVNRLNITKESLVTKDISVDSSILLGINLLGINLGKTQYDKIKFPPLSHIHLKNVSKQYGGGDVFGSIFNNMMIALLFVLGVLLLSYFIRNNQNDDLENESPNIARCQKIMCENNLRTRADYRNWLRQTHTDKGLNPELKAAREAKFKELYPTIKSCKENNMWCSSVSQSNTRNIPESRRTEDDESEIRVEENEENKENEREGTSSIWIKIRALVFFTFRLSIIVDREISQNLITQLKKKNRKSIINRKVFIPDFGEGTVVGLNRNIFSNVFFGTGHIIRFDNTGEEKLLVLGDKGLSCSAMGKIFRFVRQELGKKKKEDLIELLPADATSDEGVEIDLMDMDPLERGDYIVYLGRSPQGIPTFPAVKWSTYKSLLTQTPNHPFLGRPWSDYDTIEENGGQPNIKDPRVDQFYTFPEISESQKELDDKLFLSSTIPHYKSKEYKKHIAKKKMNTKYGRRVYRHYR